MIFTESQFEMVLDVEGSRFGKSRMLGILIFNDRTEDGVSCHTVLDSFAKKWFQVALLLVVGRIYATNDERSVQIK